jgi:uncharacterized protein YkwD
MFHVKHLVFVLLLPVYGWTQAYFKLEDKPFVPPQWADSEIREQVIRQVIGRKLEAQEISFYYWCNMMRRNPRAFHEKVILPFLEQFPEANGSEAKSLAEDLLSIERLPLFEFSNLARETAVDHAMDLVKMDKLSHTGSDGRSFSQRIRISGITRCAGENIYTGKPDGLLALIMLLLDIGLDTAGHRKALLSPYYFYMAPALMAHQTEKRHILVQVFTCK